MLIHTVILSSKGAKVIGHSESSLMNALDWYHDLVTILPDFPQSGKVDGRKDEKR